MTKTIEIFAGPNGSGKTTFSEKILEKRKEPIIINTDKIASGITLRNSEYAQFEAGRVMLNQMESAFAGNKTFAFETTMSGRIWTSHLKKARTSGYHIIIYFIFVRSIALSLKRIQNRVKEGGHNIPENIVKRRFKRTFENFMRLYKPLADEWFIIDNSEGGNLVAKKTFQDGEQILESKTFKKYFL
ncbi:MAG TPA: zeta toxin family protein [Bacteroidia bacterium]|nr:zeta toxin family protein [Bacteroidia bacterium]